MVEFTRKPLKLLDGIYRFVGGLSGVSRVDLASDITLVHDVSRQAERSGYGSFYGRVFWSEEVVCPGAASTEKIIYRRTISPLLGYPDERYELWLMNAHAECQQSDIGDVTSVTMIMGKDSVSAPAGTPQGHQEIAVTQSHAEPVAYWDAMRSSSNASGGVRGGVSSIQQWPRPRQSEWGCFFGWQLVSSAAATIHFTTEFWAGPLGSTPPGLA